MGLQADERATTIFRLRAAGMTSWPEIARQLQVSEVTAKSLFKRELARRAEERRELSEADFETMLAGLDQDLVGLNRLLAQAAESKPDKDGKMVPVLSLRERIHLVAKLNAEKRKIEERKAKLLALDAPERHAVLVGQAGGKQYTPEEIDAMSVEEIQRALAEDKQARFAALAAEAVLEAKTPKDPEPDDGLPAELDFQDPGPRAVVSGDAAADGPESEAEGEGPLGGD